MEAGRAPGSKLGLTFPGGSMNPPLEAEGAPCVLSRTAKTVCAR